MIRRLDHLVLTVRDLAATCDFYGRGLGLTIERSGSGRTALHFGQQKINLHEVAAEPILPRARVPMAGSADFCLVADRPLDAVIALVTDRGLSLEIGPVQRQGAQGTMQSIYLRDPDGNLVEISDYSPSGITD